MAVPVSVNQEPSGGTDYPLVYPSADVDGLLGDFYLVFDGPAEPPLRLAWLHGFGTRPVPPPGGVPAPTHARDLVVRDASGAVVFDSTPAAYAAHAWGDDRVVCSWTTADACCRLTAYTDDAGSFDADIVPASAALDPRTWGRAPSRVRSIAAGAITARGPVRLAAGHNVVVAAAAKSRGVAAGPAATAAPARPQAVIDLAAIPGAGLGAVRRCDDDPPLRVLGGAVADAAGNVRLDAGGCLSVDPPVRVVGAYGARTAIPGDPGTLLLRNGCGPCCECGHFARSYKGLRRLWEAGAELARRAQGVRNDLRRVRDRWERARACRESENAEAVLFPETGFRASVGARACNTSPACLGPVIVRFTFRASLADADVTGGVDGSICSAVQLSGPGVPPAATPLRGPWPIYDVEADALPSGASISARFRVCAPAAPAGTRLRFAMTIHAPDPPAGAAPTADVPAAVAASWIAHGRPAPYPARFVAERAAPLRFGADYEI